MSTTERFDTLLEFIEDELGFATTYYNESYLDRRITARIRRTDADDYDDYLGILSDDEREQDALLDSLSINVTSFFRNPEIWDDLRPLLRDLTDEKRRVKLWSAPCSDGREPYSMAMIAHDDPGIDESRIEITGSDISEEALTDARRGVYETTKTTDIDEELSAVGEYAEYVDRDGDRFAVRDRLKRMVSFRRHDLIKGEPFDEFDLVMCRNLFIYIDPDFKGPIVDTIVDSLVPGGYFVIGMTETLPRGYKSRFEPIEKRSRIHRKTE